MNILTPTFSFRSLTLVLITMGSLLQTAHAQHSPETPVYHAPGKKRAHVANCPRYRRLDDDRKAAMTKMTLAQAEAKGLPLCSRCPGSDTPGPGTPEDAEIENDPDVESSTIHSGDIKVYWSGKKRVHVEACRRMPDDPNKRAEMTTMTLQEAEAKGLVLCSRCPGSTTD